MKLLNRLWIGGVGGVILVWGVFWGGVSSTEACSGSYGWTYGWTRSGGGTGNEFGGQGVAIDNDGNVFTIGGFEATVNFDGTGGTDEHSAHSADADVYIIKYNADGSYGWTKTFGGTAEDYGMGIAVDDDGNVLVTGYFQGTVNFNDSGGTDNHSADWGTDIFITKYNSDGSYGWTRTIGATGDQLGYGIATDSSGNAIVVGMFSGTVNFDDTGGSDIHVATNGDYFVTKYYANGTYAWTRTFGNTLQWDNYGVATDTEGYVYATGTYSGTADFDGSASGEDLRTAEGDYDIFLTRLSPDGTYKWTKTFGSSEDDRGLGVATDGNGHVIVSGYFSGTVNFDTKGGTDNHTAIFGKAAFITKLKVNGKSVWTKSFDGSDPYDAGEGIATDESGNVFVTGLFGDTVNFDANGGTDNHTSGPGGDAFLTKYNADGSYAWTRAMGGSTVNDTVGGLAVAASEKHVYTTGYYIGTADFDGSGGTDEHTSEPDTFDFYVTHYTDDVPTISGVTADADADEGDVTWTTDAAASTKVEYGLTQYYGASTVEVDTSPRVTDHSANVPGLKPCGRYYYRVLSADSDNNKAISTNRAMNTSGCLASSIVNGTGVYTETTGGEVELSNSQSTAKVTAGNGFYSEGAVLQINILDSSGVPEVPAGTSLVKGNFYNLLAVSDSDAVVETFDQPVTFTVTYGADAEAAFVEGTMDVYRYTGTEWEKKNCVLDTGANTITCALGGFSVYGVFGQEVAGSVSSVSGTSGCAPGCGDSKPEGIADLFQIDVNVGQVELFFAPIARNSRYYISYSTLPLAEQHGVEVSLGDDGVQSFGVGYLAPNTTYYFKVRGQNGCMPGDWSSIMKVTTLGKSRKVPEMYYKY